MHRVLSESPQREKEISRPMVSGSLSPEAAASGYEVEVVTDLGGLLPLQPAWDELAEGLAAPHPFLSHAWARTWWECFGEGKELHILLVRKGRELKAIAPLMLSQERMYGVKMRRLGFLYNCHAPRCDLIVAPDAPESYGAIWKYFRRTMDKWDVLDFCQLPADSRTLQEVPRLADEDGFRTGTWEARPSPYVQIGEWESYYKSLSRNHRKDLKHKHNRLVKLGRILFEEVPAEGDVMQALCDGFRIEKASWKGKRGTAIACQRMPRQFYTDFAERAAGFRWLRLQFLTLNRRRIAFGYSLHYGDSFYWLKLGYDPEYHPCSPGNLFCLYSLREAFARGLREFDFVGVDDGWKLHWTRQSRPHVWFYVFSKSLKGRLLHEVKFRLSPWLKDRWRRPADFRSGGPGDTPDLASLSSPDD